LERRALAAASVAVSPRAMQALARPSAWTSATGVPPLGYSSKVPVIGESMTPVVSGSSV